MKRLTIHLRNQEKQIINGKEKLFNVKSFHRVSTEEALRIINTFDKKDLVKTELKNY
jgi:hypothetical protein